MPFIGYSEQPLDTGVLPFKKIVGESEQFFLLTPIGTLPGEPHYFLMTENQGPHIYMGSGRFSREFEVQSVKQEFYVKAKKKLVRTHLKLQPGDLNLTFSQPESKSMSEPFDIQFTSNSNTIELEVIKNKKKMKSIVDEAFYRTRVLKREVTSADLDMAEPIFRNPNHPLYKWLMKVAERVILHVSSGSGVILGKTSSGIVLSLTALHVPASVNEELGRPIESWEGSHSFLGQIINLQKDFLPNEVVNAKPIFTLGYKQNEELGDINPKSDFLLSRLTGMDEGTLEKIPQLQFGTAKVGDPLLLVGYHLMSGPLLWTSVGKVVEPKKANEFVIQNGGPTFDSSAEIMVEAGALVGMSGGAAFDHDGRLVGILVRQSGKSSENKPLTRIVKSEYIINQWIRQMGKSLPVALQKELNMPFPRQCKDLF